MAKIFNCYFGSSILGYRMKLIKVENYSVVKEVKKIEANEIDDNDNKRDCIRVKKYRKITYKKNSL